MQDEICWEPCSESLLSQGEYLTECPVVLVADIPESGDELNARVEIRNLLVMTQSCDLAQGKAKSVALCPIYSLEELAKENSTYLNKKNWEMLDKDVSRDGIWCLDFLILIIRKSL